MNDPSHPTSSHPTSSHPVGATPSGGLEPARRARLLAVVAAGAPPAPPGMLANGLTFGWRAMLKLKHMPEQLFDVVVTPIMFVVMFTYLFGGALAGSPIAYLQFLLPGILVQTVMFNASHAAVTLNTDLSKGIYDRFRSMPVWRPGPLAGAMVADGMRHTISSLIVIAVGMAMGFRPEAGAPGMLLAILLMVAFALGFGWLFTLLALSLRTPGTVTTMTWLILMPVTFASNIFVDPATMPDWLAALVGVNPVALLVTAVRGLMAGTATAEMIGLALLGPAAITLVCAPLAMRLYRRER